MTESHVGKLQSDRKQTLLSLLDSYQAILLDAYGVLVTREGPVSGASEFVNELNRRERCISSFRYFILTNDASRLPGKVSAEFHKKGLDIDADHIITAGMTVKRYFLEENLRGASAIVLGTEDSRKYVEDAGGVVLEPSPETNLDVLVICDEMGFPFLETVDATITALFRNIDRKGLHPACFRPRYRQNSHEKGGVRLVLANPDIIYPANNGRFGITAGAVAAIFEKALLARYIHFEKVEFIQLGKPHRPVFEEAFKHTGTMKMLMIGDQMLTDIRGAHDFGIDSALVTTGITKKEDLEVFRSHFKFYPTFVLDSLKPDTPVF